MQVSIGHILAQDSQIRLVFSGCNFNCPHCNRADLIESKQEHNRDLKEVIQELRTFKGAKELIFTGGEPLLQRQALIQLLKTAKILRLKTILETNGSKPSALRSILELNLVDTLRLSIKSPLDGMFEKVTRSQTFFVTTKSILDDIFTSLKIAKQYQDKLDLEIITTIVPGLIFRKEDLEAIAAEIKHFNALWVLKQFSPEGIVKSKIYQNVSPPTEEFIEKLKDHIHETYPNARLEIRLYDITEAVAPQSE